MDINFNIFEKLHFSELVLHDSKALQDLYKMKKGDDIIFNPSEIFTILINCFNIFLLQENSKYVYPFDIMERKFGMSVSSISNPIPFMTIEREVLLAVLIDKMYNKIIIDINKDNQEKHAMVRFSSFIKSFLFFENFYFYSKIRSIFQNNKTLFKTITICNMTIYQREILLFNCVKNDNYGLKEDLITFGKAYIQMQNVLEILVKQIQNTLSSSTAIYKCRISEETFYYYIKIVKFCIKYHLFEQMITENYHNQNKLHIEAINLINEILRINIVKYQEERKDSENYLKIPNLDIIFDIIVLTLIYYNDRITIKILKGYVIDREDTYSFEHRHTNILIISATKLFGNSILIRNIVKDLENQEENKIISIDAFFFDLKFNYNHKNPENYIMYDSTNINYLIKYALSLFLGNIIKSK